MAERRRPRIALTACEQFPDLHDDWPPLRAALDEAGLEGRPAVWSDPGVDWTSFNLVVANGAWDNIHRVDEFLAWVDRVGNGLGVPMVNSPEVLRWNIDKRYLRDLDQRGVPIVPTAWVEPGQDAGDLRALVRPGAEVVVKPAVSGGGHLTARYGGDEHDAVRSHLDTLTARGKTAMVQPYVAAVDREGETGLVFVGGEFSHAIHKASMIRPSVGPQDSLIENQVVGAATATATQRGLGEQAVAAAEDLFGPTVYARVDMVNLEEGTPALLELELLDPVLFLTTDAAAPARFARALAARVRAGHA
jgi:glutathione synthase/RimK-type ligase-like ATP-grasp enzyme